jgi:hypothetical protein
MNLTSFLSDFLVTIIEVGKTLIPLIILFGIFDIFFLHLPKTFVRKVARGTLMTFLGLSFFLQGVYVAFVPLAKELGFNFGLLENKTVLLPIGFILGLLVTIAEPSLRVLASQIEKASTGHIKGNLLIATVSVGVASLVAFGLYFVGQGISLTWLIIPGYFVALLGLKFTSSTFVAIAFDSGAVATGPLTVTFMMTLAVNISETAHKAALSGFGLVCLVALAAVLAVELLSVVFSIKVKNKEVS